MLISAFSFAQKQNQKEYIMDTIILKKPTKEKVNQFINDKYEELNNFLKESPGLRYEIDDAINNSKEKYNKIKPKIDTLSENIIKFVFK